MSTLRNDSKVCILNVGGRCGGQAEGVRGRNEVLLTGLVKKVVVAVAAAGGRALRRAFHEDVPAAAVRRPGGGVFVALQHGGTALGTFAVEKLLELLVVLQLLLVSVQGCLVLGDLLTALILQNQTRGRKIREDIEAEPILCSALMEPLDHRHQKMMSLCPITKDMTRSIGCDRIQQIHELDPVGVAVYIAELSRQLQRQYSRSQIFLAKLAWGDTRIRKRIAIHIKLCVR